MRTNDALKLCEVLESIKLNKINIERRLSYVIESLKNEIVKNEFRGAKIKYSKMKGGNGNGEI